MKMAEASLFMIVTKGNTSREIFFGMPYSSHARKAFGRQATLQRERLNKKITLPQRNAYRTQHLRACGRKRHEVGWAGVAQNSEWVFAVDYDTQHEEGEVGDLSDEVGDNQ